MASWVSNMLCVMKKQIQSTFTVFTSATILEQELLKIKGGNDDEETNIVIEEDIIG